MNRGTWAAGVVALTALALTGCAKTDSAGGGGGAGITLMVIESETGATGVDQTAVKGAEAAAGNINAAGGIDGKKIKVESCDTASDPNKATACARQAVSDKVAAVVGGFDPIGVVSSLPVLEAAKIPYISPFATMPIEFSSSVSYPVTSGAPGANFGMIAAAKSEGCTTAATVGDTKADSGVTQGLTAGLNAIGIKASLTELPTGTADVTPIVAQALSDNPECFLYGANGQTAVQLFAAVRRASSSTKIISPSGTLVPAFLKALGDAGNGIVGPQDTPSFSSSDLKPYLDDMTKYADGTQPAPFSLVAWYGVQVFKQAATGLSDVTAANVNTALSKLTNVSLPGLPTLDFTKQTSSKLFPRMFNANVQFAKVTNGAFVVQDPTWQPIGSYLP